MASERVTVTLPAEILADIDRRESNRSRFVLEAVRQELARRRREELRLSLENPHSDSEELEDLGFEDWLTSLPAGDDDLFDITAGTAIRWIPGEGWIEVKE